MPRLLLSILFLTLSMLPGTGLGAVPSTMSYQGFLAAADGQPLDGNFDLTFTVYDAPAEGQSLWQEAHIAVPVTNGTFSTMLGMLIPIPGEVFDEANRWIGIQINGAPELTPRQPFGSVPFAFHALSAESLGDGAQRQRVIRCLSDDQEAVGSVGVIKSMTIPGGSLTDFFRLTVVMDAVGSTSLNCYAEYELQLRINGETVVSHAVDTLQSTVALTAMSIKQAQPHSWFVYKHDSQHGKLVEIDEELETIVELVGVLRCGSGSGSTQFRRMVLEYSD